MYLSIFMLHESLTLFNAHRLARKIMFAPIPLKKASRAKQAQIEKQETCIWGITALKASPTNGAIDTFLQTPKRT